MTKVVMEISGGLGNQLFQLSAAKFLQENYPTVEIDCSPNQVNGARKNEITKFANSINLHEVRSKIKGMNSVRVRYLVASKFPYSKSIQNETANFSVPRLKHGLSFLRYRGYWQNLVNAETIKSVLQDYLAPIENNEIGVHIRKGDYLNPKHSGLHGELPNSYFIDALREISKFSDSRNIVLYSDSPTLLDGLISNLLAEGWSIKVEKNMDSWETLRLLSGHRFLVASNSTYSWWAGFAGLSEVCFFPSAWFVETQFPPELLFDRARLLETKLEKPSLARKKSM